MIKRGEKSKAVCCNDNYYCKVQYQQLNTFLGSRYHFKLVHEVPLCWVCTVLNHSPVCFGLVGFLLLLLVLLWGTLLLPLSMGRGYLCFREVDWYVVVRFDAFRHSTISCEWTPYHLSYLRERHVCFVTLLASSGQAVATGVVPSPPRFLSSIFIAHTVQQSHCSSGSHRALLVTTHHAPALYGRQFVHTRKSPYEFIRVHVCTRGDSNARNQRIPGSRIT